MQYAPFYIQSTPQTKFTQSLVVNQSQPRTTELHILFINENISLNCFPKIFLLNDLFCQKETEDGIHSFCQICTNIRQTSYSSIFSPAQIPEFHGCICSMINHLEISNSELIHDITVCCSIHPICPLNIYF